MAKKRWPFYLVLLTAALILLAPLYLFGEGKKEEIGSLKELIDRYDSGRCRECHGEIYAQWEKSHHARPLMGMEDWIFMSKYLKEGVLVGQVARSRPPRPTSPAPSAICPNFLKQPMP